MIKNEERNDYENKTILKVQLNDSKYLKYYVGKFEKEGELKEVHYKMNN